MIAAGQSRKLGLLFSFGASQGQRTIGWQAADDVGEQLGRQGDRATGFDDSSKARLNPQAQIKSRQADAASSGISGDQHIGQHRVSGSPGDGATDQLQAAVEFRLAANQFHPMPPRAIPSFHTVPESATRSTVSSSELVLFLEKN